MAVSCIILAAGKGKRMKSNIPKVLHEVAGKPMIKRVLNLANVLDADPVVVVLGHNGEQVEQYLDTLDREIKVVWQEKLLGTGDAVKKALPAVLGFSEDVIVLNGDTPLLTKETVEHLVRKHLEFKPACTFLTAELENPHGYGRVIRDQDGFVIRIVEEADASEEEKKINEVNAGVYVFKVELLKEALESLDSNNNQNEYYLPKVIDYFVANGFRVDTVKALDPDEIRGINSRYELYLANKILYRKKAMELMESGVTIIDLENVYVEPDVQVGRDTVIYPNTYLRGKTLIGENCEVGPNVDVRDCRIGNQVRLFNSVLVDAEIGDGSVVGPFSYIRPGTKTGSRVKIGTFVEVKNSNIDEGSKVPHLTYLGDADVGRDVNIGAGTITCNYDGVQKHRTEVKDNAFIGSNTIFIAPVKVEKGAYTAAGSVIDKNVPEYSLAIARAKQINKEDWVKKKGLKKGED